MPPPRSRLRFWLPLLGLVFLTGFRLRAADPILTIVYAGKTTAFAATDLAAFAHQEVTAFDFHEKKSHLYSGVPVRDLLAKAGVPAGEKLRGQEPAPRRHRALPRPLRHRLRPGGIRRCLQ